MLKLFPELVEHDGLIESDLLSVGAPPGLHQPQGTFWIKADHALPIAGSIKARGGIHEVLEFVENLAYKHGLIVDDGSYLSLDSAKAKAVFRQYKVAVGSTGNLGLSIGIISAALGLQATVHMSVEAKQWKKSRLRANGVTVLEYTGDYAQAVEAGRLEAAEDPYAYFVDDEKSVSLFAGYAVAASRLQQQLHKKNIPVDAQHPLFVYLPCGVGGAPGGVVYGLKHVFGKHAHCFFVEPQQSSCFLVQMQHPEHEGISVYDVGQNNQTEADGLAVPAASLLAIDAMRSRLSGIATMADEYLFADLYALQSNEGLKVEPSAAAACSGPRALFNTTQGRQYIEANGLGDILDNANHILWTTGGLFVPPDEYHEYLARGATVNQQIFAAS
ncbi:D-serine ammonia-lyase [Paenalcaligenes niemegkensis]|uniref:D-serine ammonia-lyase n=1 Tax=Paenalcaligenes niemegkensis TaxID=2895469 RepID=UPI001EE82FD1|nr:D-serine ammonia-lyase [Paenalcaligenes niemegkensis]MCQ9618138.1 D-serine ammonia-lyase [Paenalcaligenes niemegkensis]